MTFKKLTLKNFGPYRYQEIDLEPESPQKPIILFGGLNGCGKTTFLDSMKLVLYGKFAQCSNRGGLPYIEYLKKSINRKVSGTDKTSISLKFTVGELDTQVEYDIERTWFLKNGTIKENFVVFKDFHKDDVVAYSWYEYIDKIMPISISELFFFDGEKIENFAKSETSIGIFKNSLQLLFGIDIIDRLQKDLINLEKIEVSSLPDNSTERKSIENDWTKISYINENIEKLNNERELLSLQGKRLNKKLRHEEKKFRDNGGDVYHQRHSLQSTLELLETEKAGIRQELQILAAGPAPLQIVDDQIDEIELQLKKEMHIEKMQTALGVISERDKNEIGFLKEILSSENLKEIDLWKSQDVAMRKSEIESYKLFLSSTNNEFELIAKYHSVNGSEFTKLEKCLEKIDLINSQIEYHQQLLNALPSSEIIKPIIEKIEVLESEIDVVKQQIEQNFFVENTYISNKSELIHKIAKETEKLIAGSIFQENNRRIISSSNDVRKTLAEFKQKIIGSRVSQIERLILECLNSLLRKDSFISELSIDLENYKLLLTDIKGQDISPERLSAGERQLLAIAIIWGLSKATRKFLPTIIDTPLSRLDSLHRGKLTDRYFPEASHQVILLSTDEEIVNGYYDRLKPFISKEYVITYDNVSQVSSVQSGYFNQG